MSDIDALYDIRDYVETDKAFIMSTFLRGLYYGDSWFSLIDKDAFFSVYKTVAEALLYHPNTEVRIACLKEDPDVILGYRLCSGSIVHWVYVKSSKTREGLTWRNNGIGRRLLPDSVSAVTHLTTLGKSLIHKFPGCVFNPFLIGHTTKETT